MTHDRAIDLGRVLDEALAGRRVAPNTDTAAARRVDSAVLVRIRTLTSL